MFQLRIRRARPTDTIDARHFVERVQIAGAAKMGRTEPHPKLAVFAHNGAVATPQERWSEDGMFAVAKSKDGTGFQLGKFPAIPAGGQA
jgi:hypothetical protein